MENYIVEIEEDQEQREWFVPERITSPRDSIYNAGEEDGYEEVDDYEIGDVYHNEEYMEEEEEGEELIPVVTTGSTSMPDDRILEAAVGINDGLMAGEGDGGKEESNRGGIDGLFCPICLEAWTGGGDHQICCLPCGHIYGSSCIKKWLHLHGGSGKCPQCNSLCKLKDVRVLYATHLCVADEELHKRVRSLEAKCAFLERKEIAPSDVPYSEYLIKEQLDHIQQEVQNLQEQQLQIKQSVRELQESLDQHRDYVHSRLEEMQGRLPP